MYDMYGEFADFYNFYFRSHTYGYLWLAVALTIQLNSKVKAISLFMLVIFVRIPFRN